MYEMTRRYYLGLFNTSNRNANVLAKRESFLAETDVILPKQSVLAGMAEGASEARNVLAK